MVRLAEIETDHRSQWARERESHNYWPLRWWHTFGELAHASALLLTSSLELLTGWSVFHHMCDTLRLKELLIEVLTSQVMHFCNPCPIQNYSHFPRCVSSTSWSVTLARAISISLLLLNFSPACLRGEVCQVWLGNRKRGRQRDYHPPAAPVILQEPQL